MADHVDWMFAVTESDAAAIRAAMNEGGELAAAVELRQRFPGIIDNEHARACARAIAGWKPIIVPPRKSATRSGRREGR